jgi:hypothetical protein
MRKRGLESATRIERATSHRFGPEAYLTDSYKGVQPFLNPDKTLAEFIARLKLHTSMNSARNEQALFEATSPIKRTICDL